MKVKHFLLGFLLGILIVILADYFFPYKHCPSRKEEIICEILKGSLNFDEAKKREWSCCHDFLQILCRRENLESLGVRNQTEYGNALEFCAGFE